MGVPRICSRCLVRLVTNSAHTRLWCPRCKHQVQLHDHSEQSGDLERSHRRPASAHAPPPPPPPCPKASRPVPAPPPVAVTRPRAAPAAPSRPSRRGRAGAWNLALAFLAAVAVVGAALGLAFALAEAGPKEESRPEARKPAAKAEEKPGPAETARPARERPRDHYPRPGEEQRVDGLPPHLFIERREQKARLAVFQLDGAAPAPAEAVAAAARRIDELVRAGLKAKGLELAPPCSDAVFLRRAFLDAIGRIPTLEEARRFLGDKDPGKRAALIDALLAHRDFAEYWTMKWCDLLRVKSEFPINLWPNAVQAYHRWIKTVVRKNMPYDRFARALLTASGSNFRDPPANFWRAVQKKDAANLARAVALTFMGVRPEAWPKERWAGMEAFFAQVGYKPTAEWKEEVVWHDVTRRISPGSCVFPNGKAVEVEEGQDPREAFADWLLAPGNPWFARAIANRAWSWLLGRGIVHEADDIRPDNPPSNPELLAFLEEELVRGKYDLRHLFRVILNSAAWQASSIPQSDRPEAAALFAHYPVRRLEAEVLIDAICQVTGTTERYSSPIPEPFTYIPESHRTVDLADASITSPFLEMFGRSPRDTGLESERNNAFTPAQRLHLLNSAHILKKIQEGPGVKKLLEGGKPAEVAERLYLAILSRYPSKEEQEVMADYRAGGTGRRPGQDIAWALMNTAEFLCRH